MTDTGDRDTIYAVSSGSPPAAIAVLRLSGPRAFAAAERLARSLPPPRRAGLRALIDPADGGLLDRALILTFPGPNSATGEDVVELHVHGGRAVVRAVERALADIAGLRAARAGEFTRRALENGRIDLTEAEGLADLLAAETERQRRAALASAEGGLRRLVEQWTERAVSIAAALEAAIDHSDESDVQEAVLFETMRRDSAALAEAIATTVARPAVERLHDGLRVVFAGPPNSGKSTLFNTMADRDAAIVSPIAGTTRDRIEAPVQRNGVAWVLIDTAGLNDATADPIEAIGVARTRTAIAEADVVLWLGDEAAPATAIGVHARADVPGRERAPADCIAVSAATGMGVDALWAELTRRVEGLLPAQDQLALNERQRRLCGDAAHFLCAAASTSDPLIAAEEIRQGLKRLDMLTGHADIENVLDHLFGRFCIGK